MAGRSQWAARAVLRAACRGELAPQCGVRRVFGRGFADSGRTLATQGFGAAPGGGLAWLGLGRGNTALRPGGNNTLIGQNGG